METGRQGIYKLKGVVRKYAWGGTEFLSKLLSIPNPQQLPMAEYWLGAHDADPSILLANEVRVELNRFVASDIDKILGKNIAKKFGRLPYLLKLLDVKDMLSIQVHPAKHEAEIEFARENSERISLDAPHRNYKDDNHKPELTVALSNFWLLHGFKSVEKLRTTLKNVPEFGELLTIFDSTGYDQLYKTAMEMPQGTVNDLLQPLLNRIIPQYHANQLQKGQEDFWAARAALTFNEASKVDRGIFSIYFFNVMELHKGEAIFQDSGIPHAYLEGHAVEIMANSDNVLRGGLTRKHVDVKELMKHIRFEETIPQVIHPKESRDHEEIYKVAAPDFKLSHFQLKRSDAASFDSATGEILLLVNGNVSVSSAHDQLELSGGEAAFITSHQHISLKCLGDAELFRASAPVHSIE
jgi:mannose-6-phosphate isomerase